MIDFFVVCCIVIGVVYVFIEVVDIVGYLIDQCGCYIGCVLVVLCLVDMVEVVVLV